MACWRHLSPPQDTGHSVWVQEGLRGGGRDSPLTQRHRPRPGRHRQRELVCRSLKLSSCLLLVCLVFPSIYLNTLAHTCPQGAVTNITLLGVVYDGFSLPSLFSLSAIFPTWQLHTKALFTPDTNIHYGWSDHKRHLQVQVWMHARCIKHASNQWLLLTVAAVS